MGAALVASGLIAGRYLLARSLGRGSSAEVFVARDEAMGRLVALKRQLPQQQGRKAGAMNLLREYHALSGLRHPRIIEVYDCGMDGATPYYTMELLDGQDLSEVSPLPYREACAHLRDVASSLALLHDRRLLHRDVSPRNVRRGSEGRCKLIDFGAMVPFGTPPSIVGTPPCLAPEAFHGGELDQASDLFSLGALAYFTLTGRHAFAAPELSGLPELWRRRVAPMNGTGEIPGALKELVMSLLSIDPVQRPTSAAEVIDRLSAVAALPQEDSLAIGRSYLASTPLLGRARECAQLSAAIRAAKGGQGSALWVIGEAGSGKTRLLTEASLMAQTTGLAVVRTTLREQRGWSASLARDLVASLSKVTPRESQAASAARPMISEIMRDPAAEPDRALLLREVEAYVCDIARRQPLLLAFDDVHHASDSETALIAALASRTSSSPVCVVGGAREHKRTTQLASVSGLARSVFLQPLERTHASMLCAALFGDVPNLACVDDFLFRNAQGNPKMTIELAERLLSRGTLRYVAGSWILPDAINEPMPRDMAKTLMLRLETVGADARSLAEVLCVRRRGANTEQLIKLAAPLSTERAFAALDELVGSGVLVSAGDEYAFGQEALRAELARCLQPERSQMLHRFWAEQLLSRTPSQEERLEAGWHLVHTSEELRGAKLLAEVAPRMFEQRASIAAAIPAMERALEVYERHGESLSTRLYLRALLVFSSYLYDFRLADRYGDNTLDLLYPFTGLHEAERLACWLGRRLGFVFGVGWAMLRWLGRPPAARGPHAIAAIRYYAMSTIGLIGLRALAVGDTHPLLERMRGFEGVPHSGLSLVYEMARAIHLHGLGRAADAHRSIDKAWSQLEGRRLWQVTAHDHLDLKIGLLLLQGVNECWREHSSALACADQLDNVATPLAIAASLRIRMMYYLLRGEAAQAQAYRRLLELKAVESGSLWQVQWMALPIEGISASTWHDLVGMRRALERFEQLQPEAPSLARMREAIVVPYHFDRGEYEAAREAGEAYISKFPPMTCIAWSSVYAVTALAYAHLRRPARALEICEYALACVSANEREYFVFYGVLEAAYATALALTGDTARSDAVFRDRIERLRGAGEHLRVMVMHHYRIRLARLQGDRDALDAALADLHAAASLSRNPAAPGLAQRLSEERHAQSESASEAELEVP